MANLIERLGIAGQMTPKTRLTDARSLFDVVVNGNAEIGFIQITELLAEPRVKFVGPLPMAIQNFTQFAAGLVSTGQQRDAGSALITFVTSPSALAVMKIRGFEPL
jgi:molybdate transport system substrate-binding protein